MKITFHVYIPYMGMHFSVFEFQSLQRSCECVCSTRKLETIYRYAFSTHTLKFQVFVILDVKAFTYRLICLPFFFFNMLLNIGECKSIICNQICSAKNAYIISWEPEGALLQLKDVPLRTRRALLLYKVNGNSALLVLNGTSLICYNALLALNWRYIWYPQTQEISP